jgi:hypothetical protein
MLEIERRRNAQRRETRGQAPGDAPQIGQFHARQGGILRRFLEEAIITIIEEALGPLRRPPPFTDPWEVLETGERFKAATAEGFPPAFPGQLETRRLPR